MRRRREPAVPAELVDRIREALASVDENAARLRAVLAAPGTARHERRVAHAELRQAFARADAQLREATLLAGQHSRAEWMRWRARLSELGTARQIYLFAERDDSGLLPTGSVRAVDTGMSGPDIGELQHGRSRPPGTPATYGLDLEQVLTDLRQQPHLQTAPPRREVTDDEDTGRAAPPAAETPRADLRDLVLAAAG